MFYIPKLRSNLISLGQLTESGHRIVLDDDVLEVSEKDPFKLIMKVDRTPNRLYKIRLKVAAPICFLASVKDQAWLWHGRLGHINFHSLKLLTDKEMAKGVPTIVHLDQVCRACLASKQTKTPYPRVAKWRAQKKLELIHVDLCGPITPSTAGGNRYFMLLIDDYTRWCYVYVLKTKDQALEAFMKFKAEVENVTGEKIKVLRSDRGGEFLAAAFREECEKAGIQRHLTAPYSPQQNGVVERKNRTVMEMVRSLLKGMNVPGRLWGEAVRHSVYLLNRLPTKALEDKTPFEGWHGRKPNLSYLRVFGCTAHVRTAGKHLKKLEDRSKPMVYLGVDEGCKSHRLLDVSGNKVVVSRDIVCEESEPWNWNTMSSEDNTANFVVNEEVEEPAVYNGGGGFSGDGAQQTLPVLGGASGGSIEELEG